MLRLKLRSCVCSVAAFDKLAQVLVGMADRGSSKQVGKDAWPDPPKTFIDGLSLLLVEVSMGAYRDGILMAATNPACPPALVEFAQKAISGINSKMHPSFAPQSSEDTVGFAHMLLRYLGQLPPAAGGLSCAPLTPESQQMSVTFLRDCLARHRAGRDLLFLTQGLLSSDMSTAVTRELVSQAAASTAEDNASKKPKPNPEPNPAGKTCRAFAAGVCGRGAACRFAHAGGGPVAPPRPPLGVPFQPLGGLGGGGG
jgi:hypothetical protein